MAVYSYNARQLKKKVGPKKPFWSRNKIAVSAGSLFLFSFGVLIANTPAPSVTVAASVSQPTVKTEPQTNTQNDLSGHIQKDGEGFMCTNKQSDTRFYTSDYQSCVDYVTSYRCAIDENGSINTANKTECERKQKEYTAQKNAEFERDLKNYVRLIELDNGTRDR